MTRSQLQQGASSAATSDLQIGFSCYHNAGTNKAFFSYSPEIACRIQELSRLLLDLKFSQCDGSPQPDFSSPGRKQTYRRQITFVASLLKLEAQKSKRN